MADERAAEPLDDVADMLSGGTPRKSSQSYWNGSIPWLTPKDMGQWSGITEARVSPKAIGNGTRLAPKEAIFLVVRGMSLHKEIRTIRPDEAMTFNQDIKAIVAKKCIDPLYLYYVIVSKKPELLDAVEAAGHGTGRLPTDKLKDLLVPRFRPLTEAALAELFGALDRRTELNRRMNETLEAMARAIFKDWFVDFGPTRAKAEGRVPYLSSDLWNLFPDALNNEDKPVSWHTYTLSDLAQHHRATVSPIAEPNCLFEHYSFPAYDAGNEPTLNPGASIKSNKTDLPEGAVLLSKLNPEIERVWWPNPKREAPQVASTEFLAFTPVAPATRSILFYAFKSEGFRAKMVSMVTGTSKSHQRVSPRGLLTREILVAEPLLLGAFEQTVLPLIDRLLSNRREARTLAQTRDLLLPKLMSGEIRLAEAEKAVEAVA